MDNRSIGKVIKYDGHYGELCDDAGNIYIMLEKDVEDAGIIRGTEVVFMPEKYRNNSEEILVARFIRKKEYVLTKKYNTEK